MADKVVILLLTIICLYYFFKTNLLFNYEPELTRLFTKKLVKYSN
jgi:hypothetical protein